MTFRITIRRGACRFSYYGVFPDGFAASSHALRVALPGSNVSVKQWSAA